MKRIWSNPIFQLISALLIALALAAIAVLIIESYFGVRW
jgi:hypothetical protein